MDVGTTQVSSPLDLRYVELDQPVLLSGVQALVRILLEQARLDRVAGRNTAGFVSGYRGSPLGGMDKELWAQQRLLAAHGIRFTPGLNEDLAATMVWGTQQTGFFPGSRHEGVFGLFYAKGPGIDRSGDALRHANAFGTTALGGVLAVAGDDHVAQSSTLPHATDPIFAACHIPLLTPATVEDYLDFGLAGLALSRFAGTWVGFKATAESAESSATFSVPAERTFTTPDIARPPHGLNADPTLRWPGQRTELERRLVEERLPAARAWAAANGLDRTVFGAADAAIGIVTVGKAHGDALAALDLLGLTPETAAQRGVAIRKIGLAWPIEADGLRRFASGKRLLIVIEEKRSFVEAQAREALFNMPAAQRPAIVGKTDAHGAPLLPEAGEFSPELLAPLLGRMLRGFGVALAPRDLPAAPQRDTGLLVRTPAFCAGCPHSTSTKVPDGHMAAAGIGCHIMALDNDRTRTFTHMGAEGANWVGLEGFSDTPHLFVNMGDGTWTHSGSLAVRQAVSAGARVTYKILVNDAVAMTGGQQAEGHPDAVRIAHMLAAEGVRRIAVVVDDAARLPTLRALPEGTTRHARGELDAVQRDLAGYPGVSALVYDQVCATEKRRRRKRGTMAAAETHVVIDERVCENCGDCTAQSGCIAIEPVETAYGRKRRISPTACNTDLSCLKGFCPSFVTVRGNRRKTANEAWRAQEGELEASLPEPPPCPLPWRGLFAGIGGGGTVTAGAIVAMAAHLEGRMVRTLDFTGLAQKNGAVVAHVQVAEDAADLPTARIADCAADLLVAADLAVSAAPSVLRRVAADGVVVANTDLAPTAAFIRDRDLPLEVARYRRQIERGSDLESGGRNNRFLAAQRLAETLFGNAQAMNTLLTGLAWQIGLIPARRESVLRAIALNGAAVELNRRAFLWGRILAANPELADEVIEGGKQDDGLPALVARRSAELVRYQNTALAARYAHLVGRAVAADPSQRLGRAVAEGYFRVLAVKDEYEVARLHLLNLDRLRMEFGAAPTAYHMSPPLPLGRDPATGRRRKIAIPGRVARPVFRLLMRARKLRGTWLDLLGLQHERRGERRLIAAYEADMETALATLSPATMEAAVALARLPLDIRGYGPVKAESIAKAEEARAQLRQRLRAPALAEAAD